MGKDVSLLFKSVEIMEICNIKMSKINVTQMCYEKRQNDTPVDLFFGSLFNNFTQRYS